MPPAGDSEFRDKITLSLSNVRLAPSILSDRSTAEDLSTMDPFISSSRPPRPSLGSGFLETRLLHLSRATIQPNLDLELGIALYRLQDDHSKKWLALDLRMVSSRCPFSVKGEETKRNGTYIEKSSLGLVMIII